MTKYHINPETGRANICRATKRPCDYSVDGVPPKHYDTKEEAKAAHESNLKEEYGGSFNTVSKSNKKEKLKNSSENPAYTEPLDLKGKNIRAGDIVYGEKFTPGGKWVEDSKVVKSVEPRIDLDLREKMLVTYEDGTKADFVGSAPVRIKKPAGYVEGRDPSEMAKEIRAVYKKARRGDIKDEDVEKVIENMNDPNASDRMSAYAKQVAYHLEDINHHEPVIRIDAAIERQRLANDSDAKIEKHMSLIYDEKTPDDLFKRAVEEKPEAFQKAKSLYEGYGKEWNRYI